MKDLCLFWLVFTPRFLEIVVGMKALETVVRGECRHVSCEILSLQHILFYVSFGEFKSQKFEVILLTPIY